MIKIPTALSEILGTLSAQQRRLFACDCAEHVLPYFERFRPLDKRPRIAIEVARQYASEKVGRQELYTASGDAEGAAWEAADVAWIALPEGYISSATR